MSKKIISVSLTLIMLFAFSISSFAAELFTVTRPEGDETTFKKSYVISVKSQEGVIIELKVPGENKDSEGNQEYVPVIIEDESKWEVGTSGIFMKEVPLKIGANTIKVVAYPKDNPKQVEEKIVKITVLKEDIKDVIKNGFIKFSDIITAPFEK